MVRVKNKSKEQLVDKLDLEWCSSPFENRTNCYGLRKGTIWNKYWILYRKRAPQYRIRLEIDLFIFFLW